MSRPALLLSFFVVAAGRAYRELRLVHMPQYAELTYCVTVLEQHVLDGTFVAKEITTNMLSSL